MNKERTAQIKEKEAIQTIEKEKTRAYDEMDEYYRRMVSFFYLIIADDLFMIILLLLSLFFFVKFLLFSEY